MPHSKGRKEEVTQIQEGFWERDQALYPLSPLNRSLMLQMRTLRHCVVVVKQLTQGYTLSTQVSGLQSPQPYLNTGDLFFCKFLSLAAESSHWNHTENPEYTKNNQAGAAVIMWRAGTLQLCPPLLSPQSPSADLSANHLISRKQNPHTDLQCLESGALFMGHAHC